MPFCYICNSEIGIENETDEHLFPNAIGGHLVSKKLICIKCNSLMGQHADAELARQLNYFSNMLMISRDRGEPQPIKGAMASNGEIYSIDIGGKPVLSKPTIETIKEGNETKLKIKCRDKTELKTILHGYKRKYRNINVDDLTKNVSAAQGYMSEPVQITVSVGGAEAFRAICKIACNFYIYQGGGREYIQKLIPYIMGKSNEQIVANLYLPAMNPSGSNSEVSHCIVIASDMTNQKLYAYIELFSIFGFIVRLDEAYTGPIVNYSYRYDVVANTEIVKNNLPSLMNFSADILESFQPGNNFIDPFFQSRVMRIQVIAEQRQGEAHRNELLEIAGEKIKHLITPGVPLTEEMVSQISAIYIEVLTPYIAHQVHLKNSHRPK